MIKKRKIKVKTKKEKQKNIYQVKKRKKIFLNIANLQTQNAPKNKKEEIIEHKDNKNPDNFSLININLNLSRSKKKYIPPDSNIILNNII